MKSINVGLCITFFAAVSLAKSARAQDSQNCTANNDSCFHRQNLGGTLAIGISGAAEHVGVLGNSVAGVAVEGLSTGNGIGVEGLSQGSGNGVYGYSESSHGVRGVSNSSGNGVFGTAYGIATSGVYGENPNNGGYGVTGQAWNNGTAIYGVNANVTGWAGYFNGRLFASTGYKPGGGSWTASSDARLKKEVKELERVLDRVLRLRGVTFEWIDPAKQGNQEGPQIGMIAQEVEKVFPEWVGMDANGFRTLTFRGFEALTVEGMRTLNNDNQALRVQITSLEDRIRKLENSGPALVAGFGPGSLAAVGAVALALGVVLTSRRRTPSF